MSRLRRVLSAAAALLAAAGAMIAVSSSAGAAPAAKAALSPWQSFRSSPFTDAAGTVCDFSLTGTPVRDEEQYRTLASYPNGDPKVQQFRGPLYFRFTNESTGRSVQRNLSGGAFFRYGEHGEFQGLFLNNGGVAVHVGNRGFPAGYWVLHGQFLVTDDGAGARDIDVFHASAEDLCTTLAA